MPAALAASAFATILSAQAPARVDFAQDVLPLLRQNCVGCHGPSQQQAGMRLDRRSSVMKAFSRRVVPGSSANSFLYHRLIGGEFGPQMPPTGALRAEQIEIIKTWIDQGAEWPDSLANEADAAPVNPTAVAMVEALRNDDTVAFSKAVAADPSLLNARGPEGSSPFMYAVLYSSAATLGGLLQQGADPNKPNDANATALMWAAKDLEKTRLLLDHGAKVNARSDDLRTPLMIAARRAGAAPVVRLLLDRGANPNPNAKPEAESSPLIEAIASGDAATVELLIQRGADARAAGQVGLSTAVLANCAKCVELLAAQITDASVYTGSLQDTAVYGDIDAVRLMIDHGADVNAFDPLGRTPLMYAAVSDVLPLDVVDLLIAHGANVNARDQHTKAGDAGLTVLDIAKLNGDTPIVQALVKAGARASATTAAVLKPRHSNSVQTAVQDSIPQLQRADASFAAKSGCISCHNNSLTAMTIGRARRRGFRIDEQIASAQVRANVQALEKLRDRMHQGFMFPVEDNFSDGILGYMLVGLDAEHYAPDINTDAAAMQLLGRQSPDGQWAFQRADSRPPLCLEYVGQTALSMRALQLYAPKAGRAAYERAIQLAASWLAQVKPLNNDDRGWRLTGLAWAGADKAVTRKALRELLVTQRVDGGWPDRPSMPSSAYATGKAMVALHIGGLPVSDAAYQRGVQFLLKTQQEDGTWYVKTRALAIQPWFDAGFPHGHDQWISAAGTNWATLALALTVPEATPSKPTVALAAR
ncbi:MAG TPA: ankyrin repeat domain-containing protein [Vicinamibacterales bacterium]|jgi:ankyrin repeat protein|nr:ankyrin repeat domain-containing protein [Vicinamibacterales bacterium]